MNNAIRRRDFVKTIALLGSYCAFPSSFAANADAGIIKRAVASSGVQIPVIGLGSWLTFDAGGVKSRRANVASVMQAFFDRGGGMIDSSPMYSTAQEVIGAGLKEINNKETLFAATKVWIPGQRAGTWQMESALDLWGVEVLDLIHVHNLVSWRTHLPWLREWKAEGKVRHIGVTTSHGRRHNELSNVMATEPLDFVQFTYNMSHREAENRLLPMALDKGLAVVINRPFDGGTLFRNIKGKPLPQWAAEISCENWAQFFLKFIVSHPAVTCAIPATSRVEHLHQNMGAMHGKLPDAAMRAEMIRYFEVQSKT
jgi:diketogulonate reductase-like aldo/keto reductase